MATPVKAARVSQSSAISFDPTTLLTIRVGPAATCKTFLVHESFLTARSEYFRRAMNGKWTESETRTMALTEDDPETFALYLNYVYKNHLPTMVQHPEHVQSLDMEAFSVCIKKEYDTVLRLYILAEKFQDSTAKDAALNLVLELANVFHGDAMWCPPPYSSIRMVYANTPEGSPARRILVDLWSNSPIDFLRLMHDTKPKIPREFLFDLMIAIRNAAPATFPNRAKRNGSKAYVQTQKVSTDPGSPSKKTPPPV